MAYEHDDFLVDEERDEQERAYEEKARREKARRTSLRKSPEACGEVKYLYEYGVPKTDEERAKVAKDRAQIKENLAKKQTEMER